MPAFTEQECDAVRDWVRQGGSLLFIADHAPFGGAAENLGKRFGVSMGKGWAFDRAPTGGTTTQLVFSRENGLLGTHPILRGRDASEEIKLVRSFTGQSLTVPDGATVLLKMSATSGEAPTPEAVNAPDAARLSPAAGRSQGVAMPFGKGRVVILGEAGMFSAQIATLVDGNKKLELKFGMNVPGHDDRQFALNVLHWLSGLIKWLSRSRRRGLDQHDEKVVRIADDAGFKRALACRQIDRLAAGRDKRAARFRNRRDGRVDVCDAQLNPRRARIRDPRAYRLPVDAFEVDERELQARPRHFESADAVLPTA